MTYGVIVRERTARKRHMCSRCHRSIEPGTRYALFSIPPGGELGYIGWVTGRTHRTYGDCQSQPCAWRCNAQPDSPPGSYCCFCEHPEPREVTSDA